MTGPVLLCAGTQVRSAAGLAEAASRLLAGPRAVVLSSWRMPRVGPLEAVLDALYDVDAELRAEARRGAAEAAGAACEALAERGWAAEQRVVPDERRPWELALEVAGEIDAPVIVAGLSESADGRPGSLGSQARALAHRSSRPLLLVTGTAPPPDGAPAYLAFDGSETSRHALATAAAMLRPRPAVVASIWHSDHAALAASALAVPAGVAFAGLEEIDAAARKAAADTAAEGAALLAGQGWTTTAEPLEATGPTWEALVEAGDRHDAAVLVVGARGHSRVAAALLGSVAEGVVRHADRSVLLVRRDA